MQIAVRLNSSRDYAMAAVAFVIIVTALLFTANSARMALMNGAG